MKKVSKSVLKAKMFEYFHELQENGGSLIVTDFGKPVLQIIPYQEKQACSEVFRDLRGRVKIDRKVAIQSTEDGWGDFK